MKQEILLKLDLFKKELSGLKKDVTAVPTERINRDAIKRRADSIATMWVEDLRSPLEHKVGLPLDLIEKTAEQMKQLHVLSRPNNLKSSYLRVINATLKGFDNKFVLPIKQSAAEVETILDLEKLVPGMADPDESDYLKEAIECAEHGYKRAAIVLGWCSAIDKIQKKLVLTGLSKFNEASTNVKSQTSGKYKNWKKEFSVSSLAELQAVFDTDLIVVVEGMELIDSNQAERLRTCFQYRNHSAHPGQAPIEEAHVVAFFADVNAIVLQNEAFHD